MKKGSALDRLKILKVKDDQGHEHGSDGKFTSGGGGGGKKPDDSPRTGKTPDKKKPKRRASSQTTLNDTQTRLNTFGDYHRKITEAWPDKKFPEHAKHLQNLKDEHAANQGSASDKKPDRQGTTHSEPVQRDIDRGLLRGVKPGSRHEAKLKELSANGIISYNNESGLWQSSRGSDKSARSLAALHADYKPVKDRLAQFESDYKNLTSQWPDHEFPAAKAKLDAIRAEHDRLYGDSKPGGNQKPADAPKPESNKPADGQKQPDQRGFKPSKTVQEAEGWAKANMKTPISPLKGCEIKHVNQCLQTLHSIEQRIGSSICDKIQFGGQRGGSYASYNNATHTINLPKKDVRIAERHAQDNERWNNRISDQPYHSTDTVEGMVYHEVGHALDKANNHAFSTMINRMTLDEKKQVLKVSGYSGEDMFLSMRPCSEAWAESFAAIATNSPRASFVPKRIANEIKKVLEIAD